MQNTQQTAGRRVAQAYASAAFAVAVGSLAHAAVGHHLPSALVAVVAVVITAPVVCVALRRAGRWPSALLSVVLGQGLLHMLLRLDQSAFSSSGGELSAATLESAAHHHGAASSTVGHGGLAGHAIHLSSSVANDLAANGSVFGATAGGTVSAGVSMLFAHGIAVSLCLVWLAVLPRLTTLTERLVRWAATWLTQILHRSQPLRRSLHVLADVLLLRASGAFLCTTTTLRGPPLTV